MLPFHLKRRGKEGIVDLHEEESLSFLLNTESVQSVEISWKLACVRWTVETRCGEERDGNKKCKDSKGNDAEEDKAREQERVSIPRALAFSEAGNANEESDSKKEGQKQANKHEKLSRKDDHNPLFNKLFLLN